MIDIVLRICLVLGVVTIFSLPAWATMPTATIGKSCIKLEVASTPAQIERGLMYRTSLAQDSGMVFLFPPEQTVKFWMYHTLIPLDMCFVRGGRIVKLFENVPPCHSEDPHQCPTYPGEGPGITVSEVIELPGGYAKSHNIKEGDVVTFQFGK